MYGHMSTIHRYSTEDARPNKRQDTSHSRGHRAHKNERAAARPRMGDAPCNVTPRRRQKGALLWRGLGRRRRLPIVRLGGGGTAAGAGGGRVRGRGLLRRLRLRWLLRAVRKLAAVYMAALQPPPGPHGASSSCHPWIGIEPCFATPFVPNARPFW
ncbi:uncharacterized protein [Lolium perenne]|uniref:uncharacterized protein n=1 Tax=Lolium perenne TaxID=4522 RepID=UPI0021F51EB4|nr:uncharacterized protein LOC127330369 [Lolium perenne]